MKTLVSAARGGNLRFRGSASLRAVACWTLTAQLAALPMVSAEKDKSAATSAAAIAADPVLKAMQNEIARATAELGQAEQPPYYLGYTVYDQDFVVLVGAYGSLLTDSAVQRRFADVTMRVGTPELDNTHGQSRPSGVTSGSLPVGNDADAIARVLWELTDREYKRAVPSLLNVRTNTAVRAEEEDKSPDFSKEKPDAHRGSDGGAIRSRGMGRRDQETFGRVPEISRSVLRVRDDSSAALELANGIERRKRYRVAKHFHAADYGGADARRGWHGFVARRNVSGAGGERFAERSGPDRQDCENGRGLERLAQSAGSGTLRWTGGIERARGGGFLP
jgi:hypothetical protein